MPGVVGWEQDEGGGWGRAMPSWRLGGPSLRVQGWPQADGAVGAGLGWALP